MMTPSPFPVCGVAGNENDGLHLSVSGPFNAEVAQCSCSALLGQGDRSTPSDPLQIPTGHSCELALPFSCSFCTGVRLLASSLPPVALSSPSAWFQIALYFWIQCLQGCDPFSELAEWACLWVLVCEGHNCYPSSLGLGHVGVNSLIFWQSDLKPKKKCGTTSGNLCLSVHECF